MAQGTVCGHDLNTINRKNVHTLRRDLGIVFQDFACSPTAPHPTIWILCSVRRDGAKAPHGKAESKRASMLSGSAQKATKCPTLCLEANSSDWPLHVRC